MNNYNLVKKMHRLRKWYTLTAIEQALFYELIEMCNQAGWTDRFTCSNPGLCTALNISEKSLIRARKHLVDTGLISYRKGKSIRCRGVYSLCIDVDSGKELRERIPEVDAEYDPELSHPDRKDDTKDMPHKTDDTTTDETTVTTTDKMGDSVAAYNKTKTQMKKKRKKEREEIDEKAKEKFEIFRKAYPGSKRGPDTEFDLFRKKHPDYATAVDQLLPALKRLIEWRAIRKAKNRFVPDYPLLSTWINQRRWETELETSDTSTDENKPTVIL